MSEAQAPQQDTADPTREPHSPSPLARMLIRLSALVLIGAILFVFHGIRYYLDPWSQAIINGIVKYVYPSDGQAETTVVLFREENLRMLKEPYPVSYERHAEILEALSIYQPRANAGPGTRSPGRRPADGKSRVLRGSRRDVHRRPGTAP